MEVISRLFNHKPAVQGEISYFLREFENKQNKDNVIVNEILQQSCHLHDVLLPSSLDLVTKHLTSFQAKVLVCSQSCERVVSLENTVNSKAKIACEDEHDFQTDIAKQKEMINKNFDDAVVKLISDYEEMAKQVERENSISFQ